jgi:hypothetical protein
MHRVSVSSWLTMVPDSSSVPGIRGVESAAIILGRREWLSPRHAPPRAVHSRGETAHARRFSLTVLALCFAPACSWLGPSESRKDTVAVVTGPTSVVVGGSARLDARVDFSDGSSRTNERSSVEWSSSNPAVATVTNCPPDCTPQREAGIVTGVSLGQVIITAVPKATVYAGYRARREGSLAVVVRTE